MRLFRSFFSGLVLAVATGIAASANAGCDVHAGDDLYAWVNTQAGPLSRQLAEADYTARFMNMFIQNIDNANERLAAVSTRLKSALDRVQATESASAKDPSADAALKRERDAQDLLNELVDIKSALTDIRARQDALGVAPTTEWMKLYGLENVGRATLLASFVQLGDDSKDNLRERYNVNFQVSYDENGKTQSASASQKGGWDDTVASAAANYYPYGTAAAIVYEVIKFVVTESDCKDKIDHQLDLVRQAYGLLPSKVITKDEQLADATAAYQSARASFTPVLGASVALRANIEDEWKEVFAFNISRLDAAHAVLTTDKVRELQRQFGSGSHLDSLLDSGAIIKLADDLGGLNAYLAARQRQVIESCADLRGAEAVEDQLDSLEVARDIFAAIRSRTSLAPLMPLLDASVATAVSHTSEASKIWTHFGAQVCPQSHAAGATPSGTIRPLPLPKPDPALARGIRHAMAVRTRMMSTQQILRVPSVVRANRRLAVELVASPVGGTLFCKLHLTSDGGLSCDGTGTSYENMLDPRSGPIGGADDGGYAQDNRRMESEINAASNNIQQRTAKLWHDAGRLLAALPEWGSKNSAALSGAGQMSQQQTGTAVANRNAFAASMAPLLASSKQSLDSFVSSPFDPATADALIKSGGGSDMSLPTINVDKMVPDLPAIAGVSAAERLFGAAMSLDMRRIVREQSKIEIQLAADTASRALAEREVALAKSFSKQSAPQAAAFAAALVQDAKSIRFAQSGQIPNASYSFVAAGSQTERSNLTPGSDPAANSILVRGEVFQADAAILTQQIKEVRSSLQPSDPYVASRKALVDEAADLTAKASGLFFAGDLPDAEAILRVAHVVLDLATRFTPGVNWGRDVYEAVTGVDLLTGKDLDGADRAVAILAAVSGGLGDELLGGIRVLSEVTEFGRAVEEDERIYEFAQTLDRHTPLDFSEHIETDYRGAKIDRPIPQDFVESTLDSHEPFWNFRNDTYVAVSDEVRDGERMGVAINVDKGKVTTVMYMPKDYAAILSEKITDRTSRRFGEFAYVKIKLKK